MNLSIEKVMLVDDKGYEFSTQGMIRFTPNFTLKIFFNFKIPLYVSMCVACTPMCVVQLGGVSSLLQPCMTQGSNSSCQAWNQAPLPAAVVSVLMP